jgi:hypothetical protein
LIADEVIERTFRNAVIGCRQLSLWVINCRDPTCGVSALTPTADMEAKRRRVG